jgi:flagellar protein FlaG
MNPKAKITPVATLTSAAVGAAGGSSASGDFHDSRFMEEAERNARYRLVIEEGPQAGTFIYKTMDRVTGEVVKQLPREQVVDLMRAADYSAGAVFDTKA